MFENKNLGFIKSPERPLRLFMQTSTSHQTNQVSTIKDNQDWSSSYKTFLIATQMIYVMIDEGLFRETAIVLGINRETASIGITMEREKVTYTNS